MKVQVKVKPNSRTEELSREGDSFMVKVKEPPKEGKANQAVIRLLAEHFGVPQSQSGFSAASEAGIKLLRLRKSSAAR